MRQQTTWVATFDEAACRVFSFNGVPRKLQELSEESRMGAHKPHFSDRAGRVHERRGERRSSVAPRTDPERGMEKAFVQALAAALDAQSEAGAFDRLIVVAAPRALGDFRAAASKALKAKVVREIRGDFVNCAPDRLLAAIDQ